MPRLYPYVGPREIRQRALSSEPISRNRIVQRDDLARFWKKTRPKTPLLTVTFIVDAEGGLWIADRHVEHVACSRGLPVLAAGELTFSVDGSAHPDLVAASNQSTGFCPEPDSWPAVQSALDSAGIDDLPERYEPAFDFRRCPSCEQINLVKEQVFECDCCGSSLPQEWNLSMRQKVGFTIEGRFALGAEFEATVIRTSTKRWVRLSGFRSKPLERHYLRFWEEEVTARCASVRELLRTLDHSLRTKQLLDDALSVSAPGWRSWGPGIPAPIGEFAERADFREALASWIAGPLDGFGVEQPPRA